MVPSRSSEPERDAPPPLSDAAHEADQFKIPLDWRRWWTILPEIVILACTGLLPLIVVTNVVARYTNWFYFIWAEDIVKVLFLWIVFLGGAVAVKYDAHVRMGMLSDRFTGRASVLWHRVIRLSPLAIGAILLILGLRIVDISMQRELQTMRVSAGYFMTVVPLSGALMIYYALRSLFARDGGARREVEGADSHD